jgi:hypothetical protein
MAFDGEIVVPRGREHTITFRITHLPERHPTASLQLSSKREDRSESWPNLLSLM